MAVTWEELEHACGECRRCGLCETRKNVVFGDGARDAEILLIGEGPGQNEDEQGVPFVGAAGRLLDDMLELTGLDRTKVYIANVVKCRPPRNRDPLNTEQEMCLPWLRRQTALLRPKLIVCLGRIAAKAVIRQEFGITREHGQWFERNGVQMMAVYHPSALLRDVSKRPETFLDLLSLRRKVREVCTRTTLSLPRAEEETEDGASERQADQDGNAQGGTAEENTGKRATEERAEKQAEEKY